MQTIRDRSHKLRKAKELPWCHQNLQVFCLLELAGNVPFACQGNLFMESCLPGGALHKTAWEDAVAGYWVYCWLPCKALVLEKATCTAGTRSWRHHQHCRSFRASTPEPRSKTFFFFFPLKSLQHLLQKKFNVMPSGKAKIFKGLRCVLREQIERLNLEMRGNKLATGIVIFWYSRD